MKRLKQALSILLAVMLVMAMATTAFAAETGSITVINAEKDRTYDLYKVFDLTYTGEGTGAAASYTIAPAWESFFSGTTGVNYVITSQYASEHSIDTTALNQISVGGVTKYINITDSNVADFAQDALAYAANKTPDESATPSADGDYTFTGLDLGYYLVYPEGATEIGSSYGSICSLTSTVPNGVVNIKATYPDIDKEISAVTNHTIPDGTKVTSANIGDTITFEVSGKVPDMTGYTKYKYVVTDTMSKGLTFDADSVVVKINDVPLTSGDDFSVTTAAGANDSTEITIVLKHFIDYKNQTGDAIEITYNAILNEKADTVDFDTNKAQLVYSNDPHHLPEHEDEVPELGDVTGTSPEVNTKVYNAKLDIIKVDGAPVPPDAPKLRLTGAKFSISGTSRKITMVNEDMFVKDNTDGTYYRLNDGTYTTTVPDASVLTAEAMKKYEDVNQKYKKITNITKTTKDEPFEAEGWVDENGVITFNGLGEGSYVITELIAPEGYNLLTSTINVLISFDPSTETFTATYNLVPIGSNGNFAGNNAAVDGKTISIEVENNSGTVLPGTGGIGTPIFYVLGGILVLGAVVVIITRKRMSREA